MASRMLQKNKQPHPSLKIGDTVLLYYNAEKRPGEESKRSGYVLSDFSRSHLTYVCHYMNWGVPHLSLPLSAKKKCRVFIGNIPHYYHVELTKVVKWH